MEQEDKLLHHHCGSRLWSVVQKRFNGMLHSKCIDSITRWSSRRNGLLVVFCPRDTTALMSWPGMG